MRVILADDELHVRRRLETKIDWDSLGITDVAVCSDGEDILEEMEKKPADLVVTDIRMARMDGISAVREARRTNASLEIILMSAYDDKEYLKSALDLQVVGYLEKPFTLERAEELIRKAAEKIQNRKGYDAALKDAAEEEMEEFLPAVAEVVKERQENDLIGKILNYIDNNIQDPNLSLNELSQMSYTSVTNICTYFKEKKGITVHAYIIERRMEQAAKLLRKTDLRVTEIAKAVGFSDQSYFTKSFGRYFGMSPKRYREEQHV